MVLIMRISSKGRYGLAAMICMAQNLSGDECITINSIAEKLGISKIYLEQVFSLLKRAELVTSLKGAQGGYQLKKTADKITALEILQAVELMAFEKTERSVLDHADYIEKAMQSLVWDKLDKAVISSIDDITLEKLINEAEKHQADSNLMYYI